MAQSSAESAPFDIDRVASWVHDLPAVSSLSADALGAQGSESPVAAVSRLVREIESLDEQIRVTDEAVAAARTGGDRGRVRELERSREALTRRHRDLCGERRRLTGH